MWLGGVDSPAEAPHLQVEHACAAIRNGKDHGSERITSERTAPSRSGHATLGTAIAKGVLLSKSTRYINHMEGTCAEAPRQTALDDRAPKSNGRVLLHLRPY